MRKRLLMLLALLVTSTGAALAQLPDKAAVTVELLNGYRVTPNITYLTASNWDAKLDVYTPANPAGPVPTVVFIHGGGWVGGTKEGSVLHILPYLEMGFAVVNVEYRLGRVALAPAAVEDCRCALRWVIRNAKQNNFDISKLIVTGHSAGGHLALTTGMLTDAAGLDRQCPGTEALKVAAIINWYGITDVGDLLDGPNMKTYAVQWLGSLENRYDIAKRVSPLNYVRAGLPPILTIHGDADPTVPYQHGVRLQEALNKAGVPNQFVTVPKGRHGGFTREENLKIYTTIREFLTKHGLLKAPTS